MNGLQQVMKMNHRWHNIVVDERCTNEIRAAITKGNIVGGFPFKRGAQELILMVPRDEPDAEDKVQFAKKDVEQRGLLREGEKVAVEMF